MASEVTLDHLIIIQKIFPGDVYHSTCLRIRTAQTTPIRHGHTPSIKREGHAGKTAFSPQYQMSMKPRWALFRIEVIQSARYGKVLHEIFFRNTKYLSRRAQNIYLVGGQEDGSFHINLSFRKRLYKDFDSSSGLTNHVANTLNIANMPVKFLVLLQVGYLHCLVCTCVLAYDVRA